MPWMSCFIHKIKCLNLYDVALLEIVNWSSSLEMALLSCIFLYFFDKGGRFIYWHAWQAQNINELVIYHLFVSMSLSAPPYLVLPIKYWDIFQLIHSVATYPRTTINQCQRRHLLLRKWFSDPELFRGICVLASSTLQCNWDFILIFLNFVILPEPIISQSDFASSQRVFAPNQQPK